MYISAYELVSAVFRGGAGGARAPLEFGFSEKGQSLISAYQNLAITASTSGFEKLSAALTLELILGQIGWKVKET